MTTAFRVPDLGEGVTETEIVRWLVAAGDEIAEDAPMVEVMTDKAAVEIPSPAAGTVLALHAEEGAIVPVGTVIVEIGNPGDTAQHAGGAGGSAAAPVKHATAADNQVAIDTPTATGTPAVAAPARIQATPLVRRVARELGVDLATVSGTGAGGRITEEDVRGTAPAGAAAPAPTTRAPAVTDHGVRERRPLRAMRRAIAEHLVAAACIPTVTVVEEADLTELERMRQEHAISYVPFLVRACVQAFVEVPELNATFDESADELVLYDRIDVGIAMQTDDGLLVPVVRDCAARSLQDLDSAVGALAASARDRQLAPEQLRGGTFTVTSAGRFGGLFTTPLLNAPEVGILGLHRIGQRPMVVEGSVVARTTANLSLTFDHRALDGIAASRFLLDVIERLQSPGQIDT